MTMTTTARTVAQAMQDIHTQRPLQLVARDHADSRVLSQTTRAYFDQVARGIPFVDPTDDVVTTRESAFFEAAASMSTRHGQSYARRVALGDLQRLRTAILTGAPIVPPAPRHYTTGVPASVTVKADGTVEVWVDLSEVDEIDDEDIDNPTPEAVMDADRKTIAEAFDGRVIRVSHNANDD